MTRQHLAHSGPASQWLEALPLGNGSLGAMVFGGPLRERIALNEATLWSGSPRNEREAAIPAEVAQPAISDARKATLERRFADATAAVQKLQSRYSQCFLPLGDLELELKTGDGDKVADYARALDLDRGLHTASYTLNGAKVRWTTLVSHPDNVLQVVIESDVAVDISASFKSQLRSVDLVEASTPRRLVRAVRAPSDCPPPHEPEEGVTWSNAPGDAMRAAVVVGWTHDGQDGEGMSATDVRSLTLVLAAATTFNGARELPWSDPASAIAAAAARVDAGLAAGAAAVTSRHETDYSALFSRVTLSLPGRALDSTLFDYGRYLLIAGSRGPIPMTLQGLWNHHLRAPWSSNYTTNINLQMNYWGAHAASLPETADTLFDFIDDLAAAGSETARRLYGANGWVAHHNADIWAYTSPVGLGRASPQWAFWPFAGAWLCFALVEHVRHGASPEFVKTRALPAIRGAMSFLLDWVVVVDGVATTAPSTSPENTFIPDGSEQSFAVGRSSTCDLALTAELGQALLDLTAAVGLPDDEVTMSTRKLLPTIPKAVAGRDGLVPEWADDDPQAEPLHRHISHLVGLYPGTTLREPEQLKAAAASLDDRGDDSTGWSLVWKLAARARLRDNAAVDRLLELIFRDADMEEGDEDFEQRGGLYPNLFSAHPPFQIDGNLGYVAGVAEVLVQSHEDGIIVLAAALPAAWPSGSVKGLVARPGVTVDLAWEAGKLVEASLSAQSDAARRQLQVQYGSARASVDLGAGPVTLRVADFA
ncbi:Alpha-L-fucosidase 2 [Vanrija pseudolonga]|uniref:Alpha-L-fucosidase 2 n=1 Tax=Vanrija pseudolonga TaxID=143232 RepID=A0AAF0YE27_9TREE|nr:Alpha-L-fucosidase 2 [Vanrija pseudolonga]